MGPDRRLRCRREAARDGRGRNGAVHGGLGNWDGILRIRVEIAATEARRRRGAEPAGVTTRVAPKCPRPYGRGPYLPRRAGVLWMGLGGASLFWPSRDVPTRRALPSANTDLSCGRFTESARWVGQKVG